MSHTLFHKMFTYVHDISFIPEHPPSPRHVKTHVTNAISRDDNIFSRHSMYSSLLHICRAPPCIRCSSSSAGVTRSVRDPPRCSSQLHGVSDQSREAVLQLCCKRAKLFLLRPFWCQASRHVFSLMILPKGHQNARNNRGAKRRQQDVSLPPTRENTYDEKGGSSTLKDHT